jgi:hypothetical protein
VPKGLSFEIPDLVLLESWRTAAGLRMVVHLDFGCDVEEFEEVLAFHSGTSAAALWFMWRSADAVIVQPTSGRRRTYRSVARAIEALERTQRVALSNITAKVWPPDVASSHCRQRRRKPHRVAAGYRNPTGPAVTALRPVASGRSGPPPCRCRRRTRRRLAAPAVSLRRNLLDRSGIPVCIPSILVMQDDD